MKRWPTSGAALAVLFLVALLGSSASAQSPWPEAPPSWPPTSLASVMPGSLGGIPLAWTEELSGPEALAPGSLIKLPTWPAVLDALGKDPEDLEVAYASYVDPVSAASVLLVALRVEGVNAGLVNFADALAAAASRGSDDTFLAAFYTLASTAQLLGSRLVWVQPGSDDHTWGLSYPTDDVLLWASGRDVPMGSVLAALPEGGSPDVASSRPEE